MSIFRKQSRSIGTLSLAYFTSRQTTLRWALAKALHRLERVADPRTRWRSHELPYLKIRLCFRLESRVHRVCGNILWMHTQTFAYLPSRMKTKATISTCSVLIQNNSAERGSKKAALRYFVGTEKLLGNHSSQSLTLFPNGLKQYSNSLRQTALDRVGGGLIFSPPFLPLWRPLALRPVVLSQHQSYFPSQSSVRNDEAGSPSLL
ncbi:hypothetical protein BH09VER1_BH09VER1_13810 [soil metagenome]